MQDNDVWEVGGEGMTGMEKDKWEKGKKRKNDEKEMSGIEERKA